MTRRRDSQSNKLSRCLQKQRKFIQGSSQVTTRDQKPWLAFM